MRILLLTRSLGLGGAERQLVMLARGLSHGGHHVAVAVFYPGGAFEEELRSDGILVHDLGKRGRWDTLPFVARLARAVRAERPDVVLTSNGANLFAALLKPLFPSVKMVWAVRSAMDDLGAYDWLMRAAPRLESLASPLADAIFANSHAARRQAVANGMNGAKIVVIPNGIDCERFRPDPVAGRRLREEWAIPADARLVGVVARLDPVKNHRTFLEAASRVASARPDVRFVCVGGGKPAYRLALERLASELALAPRLTWAGERKVTNAVYGALDVAVLSSDAESFPNAVAEAMACGKPVVVTNAGDMPVIVGDTGIVVPPREPTSLARGILQLLERTESPASTLPIRTRARIEREFSVQLLVDRTARALDRVVGGVRPGSS